MSTTVMGRLANAGRFSARRTLEEEGVLYKADDLLKGETGDIAKVLKKLYKLQGGKPSDGNPRISLKKLSKVAKVGEDKIRKWIKDKNKDFLTLFLDYTKNGSEEYIGLTRTGMGYMEETRIVISIFI